MKLMSDGTLSVSVEDATKVTRVLVEDEQKNGCLYYADKPQGEWKEKTTFHNADDNPIIEEWQSARCSVCGKYHTTPYMYYFNDFAYCPSCGAKMKGADDE